MGQKKRYHVRLDSDLVTATERFGKSRSKVMEKALLLLYRDAKQEKKSSPRNGPRWMGQKKRYHLSLNCDLVSITKKFGKTRSEVMEKALTLLYIHNGPYNGPMSKEAVASQKALVDIKKELKENKETIEFLTANAKMLTGKIDQIPDIFTEINEIVPKLKQSLTRYQSDINIQLDEIINPLKVRIKALESKVNMWGLRY